MAFGRREQLSHFEIAMGGFALAGRARGHSACGAPTGAQWASPDSRTLEKARAANLDGHTHTHTLSGRVTVLTAHFRHLIVSLKVFIVVRPR